MIKFSAIPALLLLTVPVGAQVQPENNVPELFSATLHNPQLGWGIDQASVRRNLVEVDLDLLRSDAVQSGQRSQLGLTLFSDTYLVAEFDRVERAYDDGFVWVGSIQGYPDSSAMFSVVDDCLSGTVAWQDQVVQVLFAGNGTHWINLIDGDQLPGCATQDPHEDHRDASAVGGHRGRAGNPDIDVLVVYSTEAKNQVGGTSAMNSKINLAISETNSAYTNSGVTQQLVLVHTEEMLGYNEPSNFSDILGDLSSRNDGNMDNVHALRDQYAADCVAMICRNGQYCGMAYLMTYPSPSFESSAFSVTNYSCMTGYYSFGHELGHNMGSAHDPGNAGSAAYWYSYGFRTSNNAYRTIMAYSPGTRVARFSGPNVSYAGYTMGNSSQDNARSLNNTAPIVADWRDGGPIVPPPPTLTVPTLVAGQFAVVTVEDCEPNGTAFVYYSLTGTGPTSTPYGNADLSAPLYLLPQINLDGNGWGTLQAFVPSRASGVTVWIQAVDSTTDLWSANTSQTIL